MPESTFPWYPEGFMHALMQTEPVSNPFHGSNSMLGLPPTRPILGLIYWAPESCQQGVARKQNNNKKVNDLGFFFNK